MLEESKLELTISILQKELQDINKQIFGLTERKEEIEEVIRELMNSRPKLKVGDKVRVREHLKEGGEYGLTVTEPMLWFRGKVTTIEDMVWSESHNRYVYTLELDTDVCKWCWTSEMLEKIN